MTYYQRDDLVRLTCTFTNLATAPTDPTTVTISVLNPSGTITAYTYAAGEIIKSATGIFYYDLALTTVGLWKYRWKGTGTVIAATPDQTINVQDTAF
jgi:hypothetical protein